MLIEHSVRYDAPLADVYAMLTDPEFREKAAWALGSVSVDVQVDGAEVTIDMTQKLTDIPSFAKPIAGETTRAVQAETWHDGEWADFSVQSPPIPIGIRGTRRLVVDGAGTLDTFEGQAKARLPLIGKKLETLLSDRLKAGWNSEHVVGTAWLAGER